MDALIPKEDPPPDCGFSLVQYDPPKRALEESCSEVELSQEEAIINDIFPPKVWEDDEVQWEQRVNMGQVSRDAVLRTQESLIIKLKQQSAREEGICQVRRELYAQCFEELIRQTLLNSLERGLLLLRVRDEFRLTIHAAETLYESSIAFGNRQAVKAEQGRAERERQAETLEKKCAGLRLEIEELNIAKDMLATREEERVALAEKKHAEEVRFFTRTSQQLKAQLDGIRATKEK